MPPPAENSAISTPVGSKLARSWMVIFWPSKSTCWPAERSEASRLSVLIGKLRSARIDNMVWPTAPVAPTTATWKRRASLLMGCTRKKDGGTHVVPGSGNLRQTASEAPYRFLVSMMRALPPASSSPLMALAGILRAGKPVLLQSVHGSVDTPNSAMYFSSITC